MRLILLFGSICQHYYFLANGYMYS